MQMSFLLHVGKLSVVDDSLVSDISLKIGLEEVPDPFVALR